MRQLPMGLPSQVETSQDDFTSVFQELSEKKAFSGWMRLQDGLQKTSYHTEPHPHVRINPDLKRASDGDLYTYEAIPAGRYYAGELYLADDDWQNIGELLHINIDKPFELRIGKGRNRSYGQVKVVILPMSEDDPPTWIHAPLEERLKATPANELYITLATDTVVQDTWGRFYGRFEPEWLAYELQIPDVQVMAVDDERPVQVVRTKSVESFDARSGLPRWRDKALVAGSTARLVFANGKRPSTNVLKRLETEGIGLRRGEGFGRVIFNHPAHTAEWSGFAEAIAIHSDLIMPKRKPTPQARFTHLWVEILNDLRVDNKCKYLWLAKYDAAAQSLARHLTQTLDQTPEQVLSDLKVFSEANGDKDSAKRYQEMTKFAHDQLHIVFTERRKYWRKAVILLAEALMNNREKA
ncbi:hypothetical protein HC928_10100 [bacterium]|nr:hypothetical protein [bacterium]